MSHIKKSWKYSEFHRLSGKILILLAFCNSKKKL
jgi:hypothetical protein